MSLRIRSIGAVALGFVLIGALSTAADALVRKGWPELFDASGRTDDTALLLATLGYVGVIATFGCWLAARLAPDRPLRHGVILGLLGAAFIAVMSVLMWSAAPAWYHVAAIILATVWGWLGGRIAESQVKHRSRDQAMAAMAS